MASHIPVSNIQRNLQFSLYQIGGQPDKQLRARMDDTPDRMREARNVCRSFNVCPPPSSAPRPLAICPHCSTNQSNTPATLSGSFCATSVPCILCTFYIFFFKSILINQLFNWLRIYLKTATLIFVQIMFTLHSVADFAVPSVDETTKV